VAERANANDRASASVSPLRRADHSKRACAQHGRTRTLTLSVRYPLAGAHRRASFEGKLIAATPEHDREAGRSRAVGLSRVPQAARTHRAATLMPQRQRNSGSGSPIGPSVLNKRKYRQHLRSPVHQTRRQLGCERSDRGPQIPRFGVCDESHRDQAKRLRIASVAAAVTVIASKRQTRNRRRPCSANRTHTKPHRCRTRVAPSLCRPMTFSASTPVPSRTTPANPSNAPNASCCTRDGLSCACPGQR